jgi:outer membrane protein insertion porin family/translocation and assembly module TamA
MRRLLPLTALLLATAGTPSSAGAVHAEALSEDVAWRVADISVEGNEALPAGEIEKAMLTQQRAWYAPWRELPPFDRVTFQGDLERVRRLYESRGYYGAEVSYDLTPDDEEGTVAIAIRVAEGEPVLVEDVAIDTALSGPEKEIVERGLRSEIPLAPGAVFVESEYLRGDEQVRAFFLDRGHARAQTTRRAEVDRERRTAKVRYAATPGPVARFGETSIVGTEDVDPHLVERELEYEPGEQFSLEKIDKSQAKIVGLDLFRGVRLTPELAGPDPAVVPMRVDVKEKPPREIRIGLGYSTDVGPRGQIQWEHRNWLGGGRRLFLSLRGSLVRSDAEATLVQPHMFSEEANRGILSFKILRDDEETYDLLGAQLVPRFEHRFSPRLLGWVGYRVEYDRVSDVDQATRDAIGGVKEKGLLSGPGIGLVWDTSDHPLDPKEGEVLSLEVAQAGVIWGGAYRYWRAVVEGKKYLAIGWKTVLALRAKLGLADAIGDSDDLPIFERFYAGGEKSVRGYARHRLGPLSSTDRPLGGLSLFEGSVELRRPIWGPIGGAVFVDFGQVSLDAFDPPINDLKFAPGFGVTYATPIGPLRLDMGFPIDPPSGDASWQLHFSIGQFF